MKKISKKGLSLLFALVIIVTALVVPTITASAEAKSITVYVYATGSQKGCQLVATTETNSIKKALTTPGADATANPGTKLPVTTEEANGYAYPSGWMAQKFDDVENVTFTIYFEGQKGASGESVSGSKSSDTFTTTGDIWVIPENYYASSLGLYDVDFLAYNSNPYINTVDSSELGAMLEFGKDLGNNLPTANMERAKYESTYKNAKLAYDKYKDTDQAQINIYTGLLYNKIRDLAKEATANKHPLRQAIINAKQRGVSESLIAAAIAVRDITNSIQTSCDAQVKTLNDAPVGEPTTEPITAIPTIPTVPEKTEPIATLPTSEYLLGDSDLSGRVDIRDATLIQKDAADLAEVNDRLCADTNEDGKVDIKDATVIQKHLADIETNTRCGQMIKNEVVPTIAEPTTVEPTTAEPTTVPLVLDGKDHSVAEVRALANEAHARGLESLAWEYFYKQYGSQEEINIAYASISKALGK